ncbi:MAG TPA: hypothetical protein VFP49_01250 [Nitrososphaeraceae archaeon]|nr:hypothetical protein [Nitrososphaeraceae archaeon]
MLTLLVAFVFPIISINWFDLIDKVYGHGLSRDESLPFVDVSAGKQIAIEGIMEPPFLNEGDEKPTFIVRTHDEKSNETVKDINYRIIAKFKNEIIMDQRFHSLDGIVSANLIPSNNSNIHAILPKNQEQQEQQQILSKNDLIEVSSKNPVTLKSKLLVDGGLYDISVILEKSSKGLKLDSDKRVDLFISIVKTFPFVIKDSSNNSNNNSNLTLKVKTYYDEITDFLYNQENSKISFKMPFTWNLNYVSQVVNLHQELIIPKSYTPLSTASSFTGTLNDMEIPRNAILIDDYSDTHNRIVHIVVPNFKLKELTNQIIKEGGNSSAFFEIKPIIKQI